MRLPQQQALRGTGQVIEATVAWQLLSCQDMAGGEPPCAAGIMRKPAIAKGPTKLSCCLYSMWHQPAGLGGCI